MVKKFCGRVMTWRIAQVRFVAATTGTVLANQAAGTSGAPQLQVSAARASPGHRQRCSCAILSA